VAAPAEHPPVLASWLILQARWLDAAID